MKTASTTVCAYTVLPNINERYFDQTTSYTSAVAPEQKNRNRIMVDILATPRIADWAKTRRLRYF